MTFLFIFCLLSNYIWIIKSNINLRIIIYYYLLRTIAVVITYCYSSSIVVIFLGERLFICYLFILDINNIYVYSLSVFANRHTHTRRNILLRLLKITGIIFCISRATIHETSRHGEFLKQM